MLKQFFYSFVFSTHLNPERGDILIARMKFGVNMKHNTHFGGIFAKKAKIVTKSNGLGISFIYYIRDTNVHKMIR